MDWINCLDLYLKQKPPSYWPICTNVHGKAVPCPWKELGTLLATRKQYLTILIAANGLPFSGKAWTKTLRLRYSSWGVFYAVQYLIIVMNEIHHNIKLFEMLQRDEASLIKEMLRIRYWIYEENIKLSSSERYSLAAGRAVFNKDV